MAQKAVRVARASVNRLYESLGYRMVVHGWTFWPTMTPGNI